MKLLHDEILQAAHDASSDIAVAALLACTHVREDDYAPVCSSCAVLRAAREAHATFRDLQQLYRFALRQAEELARSAQASGLNIDVSGIDIPLWLRPEGAS